MYVLLCQCIVIIIILAYVSVCCVCFIFTVSYAAVGEINRWWCYSYGGTL